MNISLLLKEKRSEHNLTQEQLAEKIFVSTKTISNWETNKTTPDIDSLIRLATLFDLSLDNILLEGASIVDNIKKQANIRSVKIGLISSSITNIIFLLLLTHNISNNNESISYTFMLLIGEFTNLICVLYFSDRLVKITGNSWETASKKTKIYTITAIFFIMIFFLAMVIYARILSK